MMGTPAYMAPEQVRGYEVDPRTDVYSMAVVLYRLVTAQLPFKADTAVAMIQSQLHDPPTPLHRYRSDLPEWLDAVLARALAKSAAERYQTANQLREALQFGLTGSISRSMPVLPPMPDAIEPVFHTTPPPGLAGPHTGGTSGGLRQSSSSLPVPPKLATGHTTVILQRRRVAGATVLFRGTNLGSNPGAGNTNIKFTSATGLNLTGGTGAANSTTIKIVPHNRREMGLEICHSGHTSRQ